MDLVVRDERVEDRSAIRAVNVAAFDGTVEADLVEALRRDGDALVSLVACEGDRVAGHILFSPMACAGLRLAALAPLAVLPERQRRGIGTSLVRAGLEACRARGVEAVTVVGEPAYYRRFGFSAEAAASMAAPFDGEYFMALALRPGALDGAIGPVGYAPAFAPLLPGTC